MIRATRFPRIPGAEYYKIDTRKEIIYVHQQPGVAREYALVEYVLGGKKGEVIVHLHPEIHYVVDHGKLLLKIHPGDLSDNFKLATSHINLAWVSKEIYQEHVDSRKNPYLQPGAKTPQRPFSRNV